VCTPRGDPALCSLSHYEMAGVRGLGVHQRLPSPSPAGRADRGRSVMCGSFAPLPTPSMGEGVGGGEDSTSSPHPDLPPIVFGTRLAKEASCSFPPGGGRWGWGGDAGPLGSANVCSPDHRLTRPARRSSMPPTHGCPAAETSATIHPGTHLMNPCAQGNPLGRQTCGVSTFTLI
jgi:hypothetical protein